MMAAFAHHFDRLRVLLLPTKGEAEDVSFVVSGMHWHHSHSI
jgi:hypothetical protein